jgi:hypothetical protein
VKSILAEIHWQRTRKFKAVPQKTFEIAVQSCQCSIRRGNLMESEVLNERTFVCFSCMQPNEFENRFCKFCNAPISQYSSNDPLQIAYNEGMTYRKAVEAKPKLIIIFGVWVLFLPVLLGSIAILFETISSGKGAVAFVFFWLSIAVGGFSLVMIYRVTKNYFYYQEKLQNEEISE